MAAQILHRTAHGAPIPGAASSHSIPNSGHLRLCNQEEAMKA